MPKKSSCARSSAGHRVGKHRESEDRLNVERQAFQSNAFVIDAPPMTKANASQLLAAFGPSRDRSYASGQSPESPDTVEKLFSGLSGAADRGQIEMRFPFLPRFWNEIR